ncbi:NrfD/PsrC family molybdoenzyme membrane anchor subunit [Robertmurraya massiliosenegalensis]|uniref:NrfD/PsrC family molybdoenzyme membrane anchor subunit n=1 Tax=Robertmurraya massiliosenegalensis TaxID=1287657 RepID=UPI0002F23070|nr:NrfD/PsrC family molybdoenzyme membrane anchor subunit [Robertmurraya massiliosenegalensis]
MEFHALWDYRVALDLFLGGVGVGIFLLSAYFSFIKKESAFVITRIGFFLSPVLVGLGVLALMTELGKPFRMFSTFINVNPTSVTSWGGFLQFIFIILAFVAFFLVFRNKREAFASPVFKGIVIAGSVFALAVGIYHGTLLMSLGQPGWANGLIPVMFLVSSLLCGSSIVMLIEAFMTKSLNSEARQAYKEIAAASEGFLSFSYSKLLLSLVVVQSILVITWRISIFSAGTDAIYAYQNLIEYFGAYWWALAVVLGLVIPLVISAFYFVKKQSMNLYSALMFTVVVLVGSYAFKHIILYSGQIPLAGL